MVDSTLLDEIKALVRAEKYREASKKCYGKKIRTNPEFYAAEKERIKDYKKNRYNNDPEYATKMKQRSRESYQRKIKSRTLDSVNQIQ